jgi:quinol monooxygenase YgiN
MNVEKIVNKLLTVDDWMLDGQNSIGAYKFYRRYTYVLSPAASQFAVTTEEELIPKNTKDNVIDQWKVEKAALYFYETRDGKSGSILLSEDYEEIKKLVKHIRSVLFKDAQNPTKHLEQSLSEFVNDEKSKKES